MIEFKTALGTLNLKSNLADLSVEEFEQIRSRADDPLECFHVLTGMEKSKLSVLDLDSLVSYLDFLQESPLKSVEPCEVIRINDTPYTLPDINRSEWGQKLTACQFISNLDFYSMLSCYLQPMVDGKQFDPDHIKSVNEMYEKLNAHSVWAAIRFIYDQLVEAIEQEEKMLKPSITPEQIAAGIKNFNQLGDFNAIRMVAKGQPWRYDEVTRLEYGIVFLELLHNKISANFEKKYSEIISKKNSKA